MKKRIVYNAIQTPGGRVLVSRSKYHHQSLKEGGETYMVDGGLDYLRRGHTSQVHRELSVYLEDGHEKVRNTVEWGKLDKERLNYVLLKDLTTEHIINILEKGYNLHPHLEEAFKNELEYRDE